MSRTIIEAPLALVEGGQTHSGVFRTPVRNVNLTDAARYGGAIRRAFWRMRLKEWCGIGFVHPDWYLSVMIQDAKYVSSGVVYLFDRGTSRFFQHGWNAPGRAVTVAANQWNGTSSAIRRGFDMRFAHRLDSGFHEIHIDVKGTGKAPSIRADLKLHEDLGEMQPLVVSLPVDDMHHAYTHKAPMGISGSMSIDGKEFVFDPARDTANMDEHKAIYPYRTKWFWGSFAGRDKSGAYFGVNLADHVFRNQDENSENCIWVDGGIVLPGAVKYDVDLADPFRPWKVTDRAGYVDLEFRPSGRFAQKGEFLVAGIDYFQMFGTWHGAVLDQAGSRREVDGNFGVAEHMDTRF